MAQGDVANAKDDHRYYGVDLGNGLTDLAQDRSHRSANLTVAVNSLTDATSVRWDVSHPREITCVVDLNNADLGYIYTYGLGVNETRLEINPAATLVAHVNGAAVATLAIPGLAAGRRMYAITWSSEANPLTTGAADAVRSELRVMRVSSTITAQMETVHAAANSSVSTAVWLAATGAGGNALTNIPEQLRFGFGRFHPLTETRQDFVSASVEPLAPTGETRIEVPTPPRTVGVAAHDWFSGPVYKRVAAGILQSDLRLVSPIINDLTLGRPDVNEARLAGGFGIAFDGMTLLLEFLKWRPIPRTVNRLRCRINVQAYRTDLPNPPDDIIVRFFSMSWLPAGLSGEAPQQLLLSSTDLTINSEDGAGPTGGAWYTFSVAQIQRDVTVIGSYLALGFRVEDAGGAGLTSAQNWRVRAWSVEPELVPSGDLPLGGG